MADVTTQVDSMIGNYQSRLLRYASHLLWPDEDAAQDVVQEAFVRWLREQNNGKADRIGDPGKWLFRVTHNLCHDVHRRLGRRHTAENRLAEDPTLTPDSHEQHAAPEDMARSEDHRIALEELRRLPPEQGQIILLKLMENMTLQQISTVTGLKIGTVHYRLGQGLAVLAQRLRARGIDRTRGTTP